MKYTLLLGLILVSSPLIKASEVVIPKRAPWVNVPEDETRDYVKWQHWEACETTQQLIYWLYRGEIHQIHARLDTLGDLSNWPTRDLRPLIYVVALQREFVLLRRLLIYKRVLQDRPFFSHLIFLYKEKCMPIALLVSKALLIGVASGEKDVEKIREEYLRNFERYNLLVKLPDNALRSYVTTLDWEQSKELAEEYASYFTFHDAIERGDHKALVRSLPNVTKYNDEFGEPADAKAFRLGRRDISCQIRMYRLFADRFISFILKGSEQELRKAALLIHVCPALASDAVRSERGETVLHAAVVRKNWCLIGLILVINPELLSIEDKSGCTPIRLMLFEGRQDVLKWLVEGGKNLEAFDKRKALDDKAQWSSIIVPVRALFKYVISGTCY